MKITVITVCRNAVTTLRDCLESVRRQQHPEVEHWVIDGASTDGTSELLARSARPGLRVLSEPDEGLYHAMNKGLALATGDVVGFLNADDVLAHDRVLNEVAAALADPVMEACHADLCYVRCGDPGHIVRYWKSKPFHAGLFRYGWMPPHPTFYARKSVYQMHGGFDPSFQFGADWDLLLRFFEVARIRTVHVPSIWVLMRVGGVTNRSLGNILRNNLEGLRAFRKYRLWPSPWYPLAKLAHRLPQFIRRPEKRPAVDANLLSDDDSDSAPPDGDPFTDGRRPP